jgi:hypothetical protein
VRLSVDDDDESSRGDPQNTHHTSTRSSAPFSGLFAVASKIRKRKRFLVLGMYVDFTQECYLLVG